MAIRHDSPSGLTRRDVLAGGAALGLALTATGRARAAALDLEAARREGKVVVYNNWQPNGIEPLLQRFREAVPGIQTEQIRLGSNPLIERFQTEFTAGRHLCDMLITFPDKRVYEGMEQGWMTQWQPPELGNFPSEINDKDMLFTLQHARECIIWNRNLVRPADAPKEWVDLFDPKWKGRVGMNPPWRSVSIQQIVAYWEDLGIPDSAEKLKANEVRFFEGSGGIIQAVVRGDVRVAELTDLPLNPLLEDGAPIGFIYPKSGTTLSANRAFVAAKAPHPNAAKVFMNWLMTAEGQVHLQNYCGLSVTRKGAPPLSKLPGTAQLAKVVDGEKILTPARQKAIVDKWRSVYGIR
ncbi:MAG: extracellular solute-binding protein [Alphaproteobacteria bacterium]|nr:extracellular solute-binding protein [Alphaproteobacteria bacterium]